MSESLPIEAAPPNADLEPPKGAMAIIFLIVMIDLMGFGIIIPLLPFYIPQMQSNPFKVTMIFSVYSICQFIGAPILGALSDRVGRKPVLAVSQFGSSIGYVLLGLATQFQWKSAATLITLVYLSRIIDGFTGGNISTAQAYISDVTTYKNRAKGMGMLGAAFGIGFAVGPFLGGELAPFHKSLPAYAAGTLSLISAILSLTRLPESRTHKPVDVEVWLHPSRFTPIFKNRMLVNLLLVSFFLMAAFVMMESTAGLYFNYRFGWEARQVGRYFGYIGLIIIIVQGGLIGRLTKRFGDWPLAIAGPLLVAAGMIGYVWISYGAGLGALFVAGALNAAGRSFQMPTISSLISKFSDKNQQGVVFGLYSGLSSLARVAGPILAGIMYPYMNHTGQFFLAFAIAIAMACWLMTIQRPAPLETSAVPATVGAPTFDAPAATTIVDDRGAAGASG